MYNHCIFLRLKKKLEIFFPLWLGTVHGCIAPKFDTCSIFRFLAKPLITQKTRFSKNFRISENMTHPKVSEVIQYPLLHTIIGPNTFSVVKATLQLQMSVCPSVSLSVSLKSKPLSLSESSLSAVMPIYWSLRYLSAIMPISYHANQPPCPHFSYYAN